MLLSELLLILAMIGVVALQNSTIGTIPTNRKLEKREVDWDRLGGIPSTLLIGKKAYNLIESIGAKKTDNPFQCITSARFQAGRSSPSTVKMCTRSFTSEWHRNTLYVERFKSGFQYRDDSLKIKYNPLKWAWFEYMGSVCIHYLAFSCGPSTVDGVRSKGTNFIIGSDILEKWYTWNTDKNLRGIRRCGKDNKGVRLDSDVEVSFTVKREAFYCGEEDQFCIANNAFFDKGFVNCYNS